MLCRRPIERIRLPKIGRTEGYRSLVRVNYIYITNQCTALGGSRVPIYSALPLLRIHTRTRARAHKGLYYIIYIVVQLYIFIFLRYNIYRAGLARRISRFGRNSGYRRRDSEIYVPHHWCSIYIPAACTRRVLVGYYTIFRRRVILGRGFPPFFGHGVGKTINELVVTLLSRVFISLGRVANGRNK